MPAATEGLTHTNRSSRAETAATTAASGSISYARARATVRACPRQRIDQVVSNDLVGKRE